jgi:UDP-MurNAc hydroxylase
MIGCAQGDGVDEVILELLGQASVGVRLGDVEVISDPWVLRKAQLGAWEPYPPRTADDIRLQCERVERATHIYISHDHADHFDPEFLAQLSPKQLVTAHFHNAGFRSALRSLSQSAGHTLHELAPGETLALGPSATLRVIPEQPRFRTNSMLLVQTPIGAVLNANDCGLNSASLLGIARRQRVRVFLYTLNFMANGYPFPYLNSDDPDLLASMTQVRDQVLSSFRLAMQTLQPELSLAFAGPVTFPHLVNEHLNAHPEALDWRRMLDALSASGSVAWPASGARVVLRASSLALEQPSTWAKLLAEHPRTPASKLGPVEPLDRVRLKRAAQSFSERVGGAVARSGQRLGIALYCSAVASLQDLESGAHLGTLRIDLDDLQGPAWVERIEAPYLHVVSTPSVLAGFLGGSITLDELLLSAHARFSREPDVFHGMLHNFLRFGHDAEATNELLSWLTRRAESSATIEREVGEKRFTLPKFCPHEGESLELATIEDGRIVCPRHKWCFDIETGACVGVGDPAVNLYQHVRGA